MKDKNMKKKPSTIIELMIKDLNELIDKTNDPQAIYPLEAAKELILKRNLIKRNLRRIFMMKEHLHDTHMQEGLNSIVISLNNKDFSDIYR